MAVTARISQLWVYPIKSCGGIRLHQAAVVPGGLQGDRRYMIVDADGRFMTRRTEPRLSRVSVTWQGDRFITMADGADPLSLPERPDEKMLGEDLVRSEVWSDEVLAHEVPEGSRWFSRFLGRAVRLVFMPDAALRQVNPKRSQPGDQVSFADGYPLLLCTESSLADLNSRLTTAVGMERFRPNVVLEGTPAYAEDKWSNIALGSIPFVVPKACDRCVVTTLEEGTGRASKEPLRTLATFRKWDGAVWFGVNLIPRAHGVLQIGDRFESD